MPASATQRLISAQARLAKLQAEVDALVIEAATEVNVETLREGDTVKFNYGRAEKARELVGIVQGVKATDKGQTLVRVKIGSGFDAEVVTTFATSITEVFTG
jgi:recombinational DNA repair ATPase RecF